MNDSTSEGQSECAVLSLTLGVWVWEFKFDYTISVFTNLKFVTKRCRIAKKSNVPGGVRIQDLLDRSPMLEL